MNKYYIGILIHYFSIIFYILFYFSFNSQFYAQTHSVGNYYMKEIIQQGITYKTIICPSKSFCLLSLYKMIIKILFSISLVQVSSKSKCVINYFIK